MSLYFYSFNNNSDNNNSFNNNNNNNNNLYSANLYINIFGCALQYCYIKFMLKVTKAWELLKTTVKNIKNYKKNLQ